jgi:hypothetical protein
LKAFSSLLKEELMKKYWYMFASLVLALSIFALFPGGVASARSLSPSSCDEPLSTTTMDAHGSDSANVSATIWYDTCTEEYYASANSFPNSTGFAFHGTIDLYDATTGGDIENTCNSAGICNTPEMDIYNGDAAEITYLNNNGVFYSCTNASECYANAIYGYQYYLY